MGTLATFAKTIMLMTIMLVASSICPSTAQAEETPRWSVRAGVVVLNSDSPFSVEKPSGGSVHAGGSVELGTAIAVQYRISDSFGVELATVYSKTPDVEEEAGGDGYELGEGSSFKPVVVGANFHLVSSDRFDLFIGPRAAYAEFGDFELEIDGDRRSFEVGSEFGLGAAIGLGYRIGHSRWSLVAEAMFLDMDQEISEQGTEETTVGGFDPFVANLGVAYRF